eukprot:239154-Amphidinium_carterae.1
MTNFNDEDRWSTGPEFHCTVGIRIKLVQMIPQTSKCKPNMTKQISNCFGQHSYCPGQRLFKFNTKTGIVLERGLAQGHRK